MNNITLDDKYYLNTLLCLLKDNLKNLTVALTEASNEELYKEYKKIFDELSLFQRKTYDLIYKMGWYKLESVNKTKIKTLLSDLESDMNNLE